MIKQKVNIRLKSFDSKLLDRAVKSIVLTLSRTGVHVDGPVFLPRKIMKFVLNRSPHVDKTSREQFEIRVHKRLICLPDANNVAVQALMNLQLPAGVDVSVKVVGGDEK